MISCDRCQEWFHGDCVGISELQGRKLERSGQDYVCPICTSRSQSQIQLQGGLPECLSLLPSGEVEEVTEEQAVKVSMGDGEKKQQIPVQVRQ